MSGTAKLETIGVCGLWGLEQLERRGLGTARLAVTLLTGSVTVYYLLLVLFGAGIPSLAGTRGMLILGVLSGLLLWAALALARWTQADLEGLLPIAPEIEPSLDLLRPTWGLVLACFGFYAIIFVATFQVRQFGFQVSVAGMVRHAADPLGFYELVVLPFMAALCSTPCLVVVIRQVKALTYATRHIDIDVLELDHYPRLANPPIRFVIVALMLASFMPIITLPTSDPDGTAAVFLSLTVIALVSASLAMAFAYPVWVLRGRIRAAKDRELDCVFRSLRGDEEAMSRSRISDRAHSLGFSELLDYRIFIESLWDWPVAPHLHKVLLFGLLPPTTWVLAALIENAISVVFTG